MRRKIHVLANLNLDQVLQWSLVLSFVGAIFWQPLFFVACAAGIAYATWGDSNT